MTDYRGSTWNLNFGEIGERHQFRIGYIGQPAYEAYFEASQASELSALLGQVGTLQDKDLLAGDTLQVRKIFTGFFNEIAIEPRLDQYPAQIMRLQEVDVDDLIYVINLFVADLETSPDDWDFTKLGLVDPETGTIKNKYLPDTIKADLDALRSDLNGRTFVSALDYGATGDGATDDGPALQAALDSAGQVFLPPGTYLTNQTLRLPSNSRIVGSGIGVSTIFAGALLPNEKNVITNSLNNETYRSTYNRGIYLADFTIDGNHSNRPGTLNTPVGWNGRASNLFFSTVEHSLVERVESVRGALHNFAVDASAMPTSEGPTFYPPGPSRFVTMLDCISRDQSADDGFTTHFSHDLVFDRCVATHTSPSALYPDKGQGGIEVDDGSWRVMVRDCYVQGLGVGFLAKSHGSIWAPTYDTTFINCVAEGCGIGFMTTNSASTSGPMVGRASTIIFDKCKNISPVAVAGPITNKLTAMWLSSSQNVIVRDFLTRDSPTGGFIIEAGPVTLDGIRGERVWTGTGLEAQGFIQFPGVFAGGGRVRNVKILGEVSGPVLFNAASVKSATLDVEGIEASAVPGASFPCVSDSFCYQGRTYMGIKALANFSSPIAFRGGGGASQSFRQYGPHTIIEAGSPNSVVTAPAGWICTNADSVATSRIWVKGTDVTNQGWLALALS